MRTRFEELIDNLEIEEEYGISLTMEKWTIINTNFKNFMKKYNLKLM